jgi:hypothetical protein
MQQTWGQSNQQATRETQKSEGHRWGPRTPAVSPFSRSAERARPGVLRQTAGHVLLHHAPGEVQRVGGSYEGVVLAQGGLGMLLGNGRRLRLAQHEVQDHVVVAVLVVLARVVALLSWCSAIQLELVEVLG